ncbi:MAG TPA: hypothetical protein VHW00_25650 [Thermoanaerobaculia bacterium]|nr:hypothetical protein [Thermoanaerobaculia bacterium]
MRKASTLIVIVLLAIAGGCNQDQKTNVAATGQPRAQTAQQVSQQELTPEQLGELGAQIRKTPDRAMDLLSQRGLTQQTFEQQIRKTTENPDASKRYAAAYRKASA